MVVSRARKTLLGMALLRPARPTITAFRELVHAEYVDLEESARPHGCARHRIAREVLDECARHHAPPGVRTEVERLECRGGDAFMNRIPDGVSTKSFAAAVVVSRIAGGHVKRAGLRARPLHMARCVGARPMPGLTGTSGRSGVDGLLLLAGRNGDLARLGVLSHRDGQPQHAVGAVGGDVVGV